MYKTFQKAQYFKDDDYRFSAQDKTHENINGVINLFIIPLVVILTGWTIVSLLTGGVARNALGLPDRLNEDNSIQYGIGGGPR